MPMLPFFQSFVRKLIIIFLLTTGAWILMEGWSAISKAQKLSQNKAEVTGRVLNHSSRQLGKGGQSLQLLVAYTSASGTVITKSFDVDSSDYKTGLAKGTVTVTYWPEDPQVSRVTDFAILPYYVLVCLGMVMVLAGGVSLGLLLRDRRQPISS